MARQFLNVVIGNLPDNTEGLIVPQDIRDVVDSCVQDEAALTSTSQTPVTVSIGSTWTTLSDALGATIYDTQVGGDGDFLKPNITAGTIVSKDVDGWSYNAKGAVQIDAGTNVVVECTLGLDGAAGDLVGSIVGTAGARLQGLYVERYVPSVLANSAFSLMLRAPAGITDVDVVVRTFGLIILPTKNP